MNLPRLLVLGSEPVRAGVLPLGGAGLREASAYGKRPSAQPAGGPLWQAEDSSPLKVEGRGVDEKDQGPSLEARPLPLLALSLLLLHLTLLVFGFWSCLTLKLPSPTSPG